METTSPQHFMAETDTRNYVVSENEMFGLLRNNLGPASLNREASAVEAQLREWFYKYVETVTRKGATSPAGRFVVYELLSRSMDFVDWYDIAMKIVKNDAYIQEQYPDQNNEEQTI